MILLFDTHAHLTSEKMLPHLEGVLERAEQSGVRRIVNICTDQKSLEEGLLLSQRYPWIYNAAATTPHDVEAEGELFFPFVEKAAAEGKLIAIGETGLDYFYEHSDKKTQQHFLLAYFALALKSRLPLIFHCRDAFEDLFALSDANHRGGPGLLHCFTGTLEQARGVLDRGWYLSISGIATFKKSGLLRQVAAYVPLDRLVIETDAPYLAPESHRGKQNEPSFIRETAEVIAKVRGMSVDELAQKCSENANRFFGIRSWG